MKNYLIHKVLSDAANNQIDKTEPLLINHYPWGNGKYTPNVEARILYNESAFLIKFKVYEEKAIARYINMNDDVFKDSCVEFFFQPDPKNDNRYFNFEVNCIGTLLLGLGGDRKTRRRLREETPGQFNIISSLKYARLNIIPEGFWTVEYSIPFAFINKHFPEKKFQSGDIIKANFYKCGDETEQPHFGMWNPISLPAPDFHRPEFFGELILE